VEGRGQGVHREDRLSHPGRTDAVNPVLVNRYHVSHFYIWRIISQSQHQLHCFWHQDDYRNSIIQKDVSDIAFGSAE
ncbi:hypothetical protein, partial [Aeromonas caviae]|uniref:hypothetical protein n=1 Tax=Aeromonas caviae TaxID=648 RepID=UPI0030154D8A